MIAWENQNISLLQTIHETLLDRKSLKLQIEQSDFTLKNKDIELVIKKVQYQAGKADIIDFNNAVMAKNNQLKREYFIKKSAKIKRV